ncbi:MAG: radical SAM protein [Anaerolineae bacterium]|nr:radical SAM protein [Anaerolineae bacterium]
MTAVTLRHHAAEAQSAWKLLLERPFAPLCLTLYLNNECNLRCSYCYSMPSPRRAPRLNPAAVEAAARVVARNCQRAGRPFTVVFHGGGEPTLDWPYAEILLNTVERVAAEFDLPLFRYIATNGVMPESKAAKMAARFDLIGLSCDGPPMIQNAQRPRLGGQASAAALERTAKVVHQIGKALHVRVTVTHESAMRQHEIADYLCNRIYPTEIHVEPVYRVGRGQTSNLDDATAFVEGFWEARATARQYGVSWLTSGSRPGDIHGPYCHVFRDVLQLVPGDVATACFKITTAAQSQGAGLSIGHETDGEFAFDQERVDALRTGFSSELVSCTRCFNRYHCVRGCPEFCLLDGTSTTEGFRCHVQRLLSSAFLREAVALLRPVARQNGIAGQVVNIRM